MNTQPITQTESYILRLNYNLHTPIWWWGRSTTHIIMLRIQYNITMDK